MKKDEMLGLGIMGVVGVGMIGFFKWLFDKSEEDRLKAEAEKKEFENFKRDLIEDRNLNYASIKDATISNNLLDSTSDRSYAFEKAKSLLSVVDWSTNVDSLLKAANDMEEFLDSMTTSKKAASAYLDYLRSQDKTKAEKAKEAAIRRSEREKLEHEENITKMHLQAEEKKGEHIVEAIKAVSGANKEASDVNVTINNSKED